MENFSDDCLIFGAIQAYPAGDRVIVKITTNGAQVTVLHLSCETAEHFGDALLSMAAASSCLTLSSHLRG